MCTHTLFNLTDFTFYTSNGKILHLEKPNDGAYNIESALKISTNSPTRPQEMLFWKKFSAKNHTYLHKAPESPVFMRSLTM